MSFPQLPAAIIADAPRLKFLIISYQLYCYIVGGRNLASYDYINSFSGILKNQSYATIWHYMLRDQTKKGGQKDGDCAVAPTHGSAWLAAKPGCIPG